ncbi:hypothetical protein ACFFJI_04235 [Allobacillus sp. GCM10007491]|uniref:Uncharacterized protein n=1 Tax=Allobacillus saliphilus TaxID=2912308 RepID=A0A941CX23_9BACI|nr:hypothetical protein [Allobacillus saliphilus]MBR7553983.1 hypothetical protein [Allobacillus saliphilus]
MLNNHMEKIERLNELKRKYGSQIYVASKPKRKRRFIKGYLSRWMKQFQTKSPAS